MTDLSSGRNCREKGTIASEVGGRLSWDVGTTIGGVGPIKVGQISRSEYAKHPPCPIVLVLGLNIKAFR